MLLSIKKLVTFTWSLRGNKSLYKGVSHLQDFSHQSSKHRRKNKCKVLKQEDPNHLVISLICYQYQFSIFTYFICDLFLSGLLNKSCQLVLNHFAIPKILLQHLQTMASGKTQGAISNYLSYSTGLMDQKEWNGKENPTKPC